MKLRILIVDDEAAIRDEIAEALQEAGFDTRMAPDGKAAAELALAEGFDICLSDIRMPTMGGVELLKQLGATSPETAVILMTAYAERETALEGLRFGAVDFLLKPIQREELLSKLRRIADHRRLVLENRNLRRAVESFQGVTPREPEYPAELDAATREFERAHILKAIEKCGGNKRMAAKVLGIGATSLYRKLGEPTDSEPV